MIKLSLRKRFAIWVLRKTDPDQILLCEYELTGIYNSKCDRYLYSLTESRNRGGPLGWSEHPFGFTEEGMREVLTSRHLSSYDGIFMIPVTVITERLKTSLITTEEISRDHIPDFTEAIEFSAKRL